MSQISATDVKSGTKLLIDNQPCSTLKNEMVKPGKGQAFCRVRYRNLVTGRVLDKTFKSNEKVEKADVNERDLQYLYSDGEYFHFMDPISFEQYQISQQVIADTSKWLEEQFIYMVTFFDERPISVEPPAQLVKKVIDTDPGLKGDTSGTGGKPATLEGGAVVNVPLFIQIGEKIIVNTQSNQYISRAKD